MKAYSNMLLSTCIMACTNTSTCHLESHLHLAFFKRVMEGLLGGMTGVTMYLDDILIAGSSEQEHLATLEQVLHKLSAAGLLLRRDKCTFMVSLVTYLGHRIRAEVL